MIQWKEIAEQYRQTLIEANENFGVEWRRHLRKKEEKEVKKAYLGSPSVKGKEVTTIVSSSVSTNTFLIRPSTIPLSSARALSEELKFN